MFKKADFVLAALLLILGIGGLVVLRSAAGPSSSVVVTVDGKAYGSYELGKDAVIDIRTEYGSNTLVINDNTAAVTQADCPGKDCIRFGKISQEGQVILCLPHKLAVRIESGSGDAPDGVTY